jgi:hypothetical protein
MNRVGKIKPTIMKKFFLLSFSLIGYMVSNSQITQVEWENMMRDANSEIYNVFSVECPKEISVDSFINGVKRNHYKLSQKGETQVWEALTPITNYGESMANLHQLEIDPEDRISDLIFYGSASPYFYSVTINNIAAPDWDDFIECGAIAIGADAIYALSQSTASTWSWAVIKKAFKTVAKKMLGPIGVAIAVISFTTCMISHM